MGKLHKRRKGYSDEELDEEEEDFEDDDEEDEEDDEDDGQGRKEREVPDAVLSFRLYRAQARYIQDIFLKNSMEVKENGSKNQIKKNGTEEGSFL